MADSRHKRWSVDSKTYELAKYFADGEALTEQELKEFSQAIQDTCEDWLAARNEIQEENGNGNG